MIAIITLGLLLYGLYVVIKIKKKVRLAEYEIKSLNKAFGILVNETRHLLKQIEKTDPRSEVHITSKEYIARVLDEAL